ncbi:MAG TPA: DMT family transporter [Candidatus Competibacteraceae bacterium]|nr:DMT family transporter [Candidatus Competibacteraceae bacterium]
MLTMPRPGLWDIHIAVLLFGLAGLFGKFLTLPALIIVFGRTVFAALTLSLALALGGATLRPRQGMARLALSGAVLVLHWFTFFHAIQLSSVAIGLLGFASFPLFITLLEPWTSGERLCPFDLLSAGLVSLGLVLVVPRFDLGDSLTQGLLWGIASGLSFAVLALLNRASRGESPLRVALWQNLWAALMLVPGLFWFGRWPMAAELGLLLLLGVVCTALSHALFIRGLSAVRAQLAGLITALEPVYGILFAFLLLGERPQPRTLLGGAVILGTLVLVAWPRAGRHAA